MQTSTSLLHCLPVPGPDTAQLYAILPEAPQPIFLKLNIASSHQCNGDDFSAPYSLTVLSHVRLFATPWTVALQAPLSMGLSRQEYWSGLPFLSPGDFPNPGSNPGLPYCRQIPYYLSHPGKPLHEVTIFRKEIDGLQDLSFSQRFSSSCCCSVTRSCLTLC